MKYEPRRQTHVAHNVKVKRPLQGVNKALEDCMEGLTREQKGEVEGFAQWLSVGLPS